MLDLEASLAFSYPGSCKQQLFSGEAGAPLSRGYWARKGGKTEFGALVEQTDASPPEREERHTFAHSALFFPSSSSSSSLSLSPLSHAHRIPVSGQVLARVIYCRRPSIPGP